jgi:hypothetical protein
VKTQGTVAEVTIQSAGYDMAEAPAKALKS